MSGIATAIAGGAILGAVVNSNSASKAADAQTGAAANASQTQLQMYNQTRADQTPWRTSGSNALSALDQYYGLPGLGSTGQSNAQPYQQYGNGGAGGGIGGPALRQGPTDAPGGMRVGPGGQAGALDQGGAGNTGAQSPVDYNKLISNLPGYQFQFQQGQTAVERNLASRGLLSSGAGAKALTQYGQGYASNATQDYLNGLRNLAGLGQVSTQATGAAGTNAANQIGSNQIYAGNAAASGYASQGGGINYGLQGLTGAFQNYYQQQQPNAAYQQMYAQYGGQSDPNIMNLGGP